MRLVPHRASVMQSFVINLSSSGFARLGEYVKPHAPASSDLIFGASVARSHFATGSNSSSMKSCRGLAVVFEKSSSVSVRTLGGLGWMRRDVGLQHFR